MKFSLIEEFKIEYPNINNPFFNNKLVKDTLYWNMIQMSNKVSNIIKDVKFETINNVYAKFNITVDYKGNDQILKFEIKDNNINFEINPEIKQNIDTKYISNIDSTKDFFQHILNIIIQENDKYKNEIQKHKLKELMDRQEIINTHQSHITKLKNDALEFVNQNINGSTGQCHVMINILTREYEYHILNKNILDYEINITNLFHWEIKYKEISFELVMIPNIHPLIPPIINFGKIYKDSMILIKLIEHPYIVKWNPYHCISILIKNIIQIIKNYEEYLESNKLEKPLIESMNEQENFILNAYIKNKVYPEINNIANIYDNTILEENKSYIDNIDIMVKIAFIIKPDSDKFQTFKQTCSNINMMYLNKIKEFDLNSIDKDFLKILINSDQTNYDLKEILKKYI